MLMGRWFTMGSIWMTGNMDKEFLYGQVVGNTMANGRMVGVTGLAWSETLKEKKDEEFGRMTYFFINWMTREMCSK